MRRIRPPRRGLKLPPPILVADSWFGDSKLMGHDLQTHSDWPWRHSPQVPGVRYVRLRATSPTYGAVIITIVNEASAENFNDLENARMPRKC